MENNKFNYSGSVFRENILKQLGLKSHRHLNKAQFAIKADVQHDVIKKVTTGAIENPGIKTVTAIAQAIGCSIDSLVGYSPKNESSAKLISADLSLNQTLFNATIIHILLYIDKNNISSSIGQLLHAIDSIYDYSTRREQDAPDNNFANWVLSNTYS